MRSRNNSVQVLTCFSHLLEPQILQRGLFTTPTLYFKALQKCISVCFDLLKKHQIKDLKLLWL